MTNLHAIEIMNGEVKEIVEVIYDRVVKRIAEGFSFNRLEEVEKTPQWIHDVQRQFGENNPVGMQMIFNILDETTYTEKYKEIGEKCRATMEGEWELFKAIGVAKNEYDFGKYLVMKNLVGAVIQYVHDFEEVSFTVQVDLVEEQIAEDIEEKELVNKIGAEFTTIILKHMYDHAMELDYFGMDSMPFIKEFRKHSIVEGRAENKVMDLSMKEIMTDETSGGKLAHIVMAKVQRGELSPIEPLVNHRRVIAETLSEFIAVSAMLFQKLINEGKKDFAEVDVFAELKLLADTLD